MGDLKYGSADDDVVELALPDRATVALVGGKGASLAWVAGIDGVRVPPAFCVTTAAFRRLVSEDATLGGAVGRLARLDADDHDEIRLQATAIRAAIVSIALPDHLAARILEAVSRFGGNAAYAVRSSATAEDAPSASFAGQHDSYLNVVGPSAISEYVRRCWASLFTDRAVIYRRHNGLDERHVQMAVVVQRMVVPEVSGVLFTADPVSGNRNVESVEAGFGLGDALVSGLVNADVFKIRGGDVVERTIATKRIAVEPLSAGGTTQVPVATDRWTQPSLTDAEVLELAGLGRRIEVHLGRPQDIEWCFADGEFHVVQSRPITTLFPPPDAPDNAPRVYVSVGHQQMMTDPMKPLGISLWQLTAAAPMYPAGGRLFVDVSAHLASPTNRERLVSAFERSDPLTGDALRSVADRDFIPLIDEAEPVSRFLAPPEPIETDPALVEELILANRESVEALNHDLASKSGPALIDAILDDIPEMKRILFDPRSRQVFMLAMEAASWLNEHLEEWLGERNVADTLTQSAPNNVTSEMGLALLDVADAIRPFPAVIDYLQHAGRDGFLDGLSSLEGGPQARAALAAYLDKYGMRCVGEIDVTRPRWGEQPSMLLPVLLANVENFRSGEAARRFEQGRLEAEAKESDVLERLLSMPNGADKAEQTKGMIDRVRTFIGYREYPKYGMVSRYFAYKLALLEEAKRLVGAVVIRDPEDLYYLTVGEIADVIRSGEADHGLIARRKEEFASVQALSLPRVITSEGEVVTGSYRRSDVPAGALVGLAVSAGTVEGRARVILDISEAHLEPGDVLVTAFTDPSWSPLFVTAAGLVTEVGGLMTHGAVIAREYGLPAVVGVDGATELIRDGQMIRVHGTEGFVELIR